MGSWFSYLKHSWKYFPGILVLLWRRPMFTYSFTLMVFQELWAIIEPLRHPPVSRSHMCYVSLILGAVRTLLK
uniref:Putative secreted protein n=1 Tax=Ixodes scapularis TaxID=6945 RepID=A0A4D5S5C4_IXOSC